MTTAKRGADPQPSLPDNPGTEAMRERAYRRLRHMLVLQQIPLGKRLREAEWTAKLGVNRSALREAFARLQAQGLIETGPKTGYFVPDLDRRNIRDILAVRIMLESGAAEIICATKLNTPQHLKAMIDACDEIARLVASGDSARVAEADYRFHQALIEASGNRRLGSVYHHAPLPMLLPNERTGPKWEASVRQTFKEHQSILKAILDGDSERAIGLLRGHIWERSIAFADNLQSELDRDRSTP
jgi:DNA-binding GntR family transcriptional regulator